MSPEHAIVTALIVATAAASACGAYRFGSWVLGTLEAMEAPL